jgi:nucleoside phosphorylase
LSRGHRDGTTIAIVAAFGPELAGLEHWTESRRFGSIEIAIRTVGIGLPAASAGTARAIAELHPRAVVIIGTCGAYKGEPLTIGDVVVSRRVCLADGLALRGEAEFPVPLATSAAADLALVDAATRAGARPVDVATTLGITVDDEAAARIARGTRCAVEHLEAFGAATACAAEGVPFAALLGIANFVGAGARAEWRANHLRASEAAAAVLEAALVGSGALGGR